MVAIVSGNSLGLELTSLGTLGSQGLWGSAGQGNSGEQVYVNAANGNLVVQRRDDFMASHGIDNEAIRTYNSLGLLSSDDNGDNWAMGVYAKQLILSGTVNTVGSTLTRIGRDGSAAIYTWDATRSCYVTTDGAGAHDTINYNTTTKEYSRTDGSTREVEKYKADSDTDSSSPVRLRSATDADGNTITYTYTGGRLTSVVDASGDTVTYTYSGNNLTQVSTALTSGGTPRIVVRYGYDTSNRLSTVTVDLTPYNTTDTATYVTTYTYDGASTRIKTLAQSDGSKLTFGYDTSNRVASVTDALGAVTDYVYTTNRTTVTDPMGQVWMYDYDAKGQLTKLTTPAVGGTSTTQSYAYDASGNVTSITNGEGDKVTMAYDANGNQTKVTDALGNSVTRTYSSANQLLTETSSNASAPVMVNQGGVSIIGSDIVKTGGTDGGWDAAFRSSGGLTGGATVGFRAGRTDKGFMVGLNSDPGANHHYGTIDYALYCSESGNLYAYESGTGTSLNATYTAADDLRVTYAAGKVTYLKNGVVLRTVDVTISSALYVDTSFKHIGAKLTNLTFAATTSSGGAPLVAENNATVGAGGSVTKTNGVSGQWDASVRSLIGYTGGAMVSFKPTQTDKSVMVGLNSDPATDNSYSSIDYALYCMSTGNVLKAYESGVAVDLDATYAIGDTLRVVYDGTKIQYLKINSSGTTVLREVTVSITKALHLDSSFAGIDTEIDALQFGKNGLSTVMGAARESALAVIGDTIKKVGGTEGAWDSGAGSSVGYTGQAYVSFSPAQADKSMMVGLNTDPNTNRYGWGDIDFAFYCKADGTLEIRESGSDNVLTTATTYAAGDKLEVLYNGTLVRYLKNGVELRTVTVAITEPLYLDTSFASVGAKLTGLRFGDRSHAELTTRYIYSATKPTQLHYAITAQGRVTQYEYNAYGERSAEITYPRSIYDVWGMAGNTSPTEAQMNAWVNAITDKSNTVRKEFTYDSRGMLAHVYEYEGTASDGTGVTRHDTHYVYDRGGRLLQTIQMDGTTGDEAGSPTTTYTYDGLGRVLTVTDPHGAVTTSVYTDSTQKVAVTYQSGAVATSTFDKSGRLISLARSSAGSTTYAHDKAGRLLMSTDAVGVKTFNLYDEMGRLTGTVDGDGTLTETSYDKAGRITRVAVYSSAVDCSLLLDASGVAPKVPYPMVADIRPTSSIIVYKWNFYDDAGRLIYEVADNGAVTHHEYDGAGRLVRTVDHSVAIYTTGMTFASITDWIDDDAALAGEAKDRSTRFMYDGEGLLIGTIDAEGYFTRNTYDYAGRKVQTRRYANTVPENERAGGGTISALQPVADSVNDQVETYFYDARGLLIAQVDAGRCLTVNDYNNRGLLSSQTRYAKVLDATPLWTDSVASLISNAGASTGNRTSTWTYTLDGQVLQTVNFEGLVTLNEYDDSGRLIKTTRGYGRSDKRVSEYRYDAWSRKTAQLEGEGAAEIVAGMTQAQIDGVWTTNGAKYAYNAVDELINVVDANGNKTVYYYDDDRRLTVTLDATGGVTETQYNALGQVESTTRFSSTFSTARIGGRLASSTITEELADNRPKAGNSVVTYAYNSAGRLYRTTGAEGAVTYYSYNTFGELSEQKVSWQSGANLNVDQRVEQFSYDRRGRLVSTVRDVGGIEATTATEYDAFGRITKSTNPNGKSQTFAYDRLGRVITTTDALSKSVTTTYDAFGQVLTSTDQAGKVTTYVYDRAARNVTMTTPEGVSIVTTRNAYGETYAIRVGANSSTYYSYDRDGKLTQTKVGTTVIDTRDYDAGGRLISSTNAGGVQTTYTYDAANRMLTRTVEPTDADADVELNLVTKWEYDAKGQAIKVTDPRGIITQYTFDLDGRTVKQVIDPTDTGTTTVEVNLVTTWAYDAEGRAVTVVDPNGVTTQYVYDTLGRRTSETVDAGTGKLNLKRSYTYDDAGNVLSMTDARGKVTRYRYDDNGRLSFAADPAGSVTRNEYNDKGLLTRQTRYVDTVSSSEEPSEVDGGQPLDQVTRYYYDTDGRLQYTVDALGSVTKNEYDDRGNVTQITRFADTVASTESATAVVADPDLDHVTRIQYDGFNRETYRADPMGSVTRNEYDLNGNVIRRTSFYNTVASNVAPSTVVTTSSDRVERFTYDAANRLVYSSTATGAVTQNTYDKNGNLTQVTRYATPAPDAEPDTVVADSVEDRVVNYFYDRANRRTWMVDERGYVTLNTYDDNGNVVATRRYLDLPDSRSTPATALANDTNDRVQTFEYDNAGRLTRSVDALGNDEKYTYDGAGNKLTFTNKNDDVWTYTYDAVGRLLTEKSPAVTLYTMTRNTDGTLTLGAAVTEAITTTLKYDSFGNLISRTEADGRAEERTTGYAYDKMGRQIRVTYPSVSVHAELTSEVAANLDLDEAARDETTKTPFTQTWYDSFGNAVSSIDRNGYASFKTYDAAGRVKYEIDALGNVTRYTRNAFGESTSQRRYAKTTTLANTAPTSADPGPTTAEVDAVVNAAGFTDALDRTLSTSYDKMGRVTVVYEPVAFTYNSTTGQTLDNYGKRTYTVYNAFGEAIRVGEAASVNTSGESDVVNYQFSYFFYDRGGNKTASIDAGRYLTTFAYDSEGNLKTQVEYSTQLSATAVSDAYYAHAAPAAPTATSTDRTTTWSYDKLNRKTAETKVNVDIAGYSSSATSTALTITADEELITTFGYDAVGNQIWVKDAAGATTRTYYDALGRTRAIIAPTRATSTVDGIALLPVVEFRRDAYGNVLMKVDRASTATDVTTIDYAVEGSTADRLTRTIYDSSGNARQVQDAQGYQRYNAYTADGKLAKTWQTVADNEGDKSTIYTAYYFDKLGRLQNSYAPSPVGTNTVSTNYRYNAFGEVTGRGKNGGWQEYFEYDNAGRLWKTNADNGQDKVYLYDLLGRQTAEITSAGSGRSGSVDVATATSAEQAASWGSTRRIEIEYDALGHVVERREAERVVTQGGITTRTATANASIAGSTSFTWQGTNDDSGGSYRMWSGQNIVNLSWTTLAYLGGGDVRVDVHYMTKDTRAMVTQTDERTGKTTTYPDPYGGGSEPGLRAESQIFTGNVANTGVSMIWDDSADDRRYDKGGISEIRRVIVYKRNINGDWVPIVDREPAAGRPFGNLGTQVEISSPVDPTTSVKFNYRKSGTTEWTSTTALSKFGDSHWFNAAGLSGTYEYQVVFTPKDGSAETTETGSFVAGSNDSGDSAKTSSWERPIIVFTRDRWGNALKQSDPRNQTWFTEFTYNRDNQIVTEKRPDPTNGDINSNSPTRTIYYDRLGRQVAVKDALGHTNGQYYDAGGNLAKEVHADGGVITHFFDAFGQKVQSVDALGNSAGVGTTQYALQTTRHAYDKLGRLLTTTHGNTSLGAVSIYGVNSSSLALESKGKKDLQEKFAYDAAGRKLWQSNGAGEVTKYWYDRAGNVIKTQLPGGEYSTATFDSYGRKASELDANRLNTVTWKYDYFGQLLEHTDLGGAVYTYVYDAAGQLTRQTNTRGQDLNYTYDAVGQLIRINDAAMGMVTTTSYDLAGRHIREKVIRTSTSEVFQDNHLAYDTLGRLIDSADNRAHITFAYDKADNRTIVTTHTLVALVGNADAETTMDSVRYFKYDEMNRQIVVDGVDANGNISSTQGHQITYDLNGNRLTDKYWGNVVKTTSSNVYYFNRDTYQSELVGTNLVYSKTEGFTVETYGYDALDRLMTVDRDGTLVDVRWYDAASRVVQSGPNGLATSYASKLNEDLPADQQIGMELRRHLYDANGRMLVQRTYKSDGSTLKFDIDYRDEGSLKGYDDAGNVLRYRMVNYGSEDFTTTVTLGKFEGYVETKTTKDGTQSSPGSVTSTYDKNGFLIKVDDATENSLDKDIVNDAAGRVLRVDQYGNRLYTHIVNGEILGKFGVGPNEIDPRTSKGKANFQQVAEFELGYRSITGSYPAPSVGAYTVRNGDTLQSIARAALGDGNQWWRIAQANGLQSDRDLRVGQTLTLPSAVAGATNDATTFKPYNPSDVIGDTSPNIPQPKKGGCGEVAQIIMVVVAVIVIAYVGPAATHFLGSTLAGGFVTGAAASVASQAVGIAMGEQKFSWKQVAASAVSNAVTAGVGGVIGGTGVEHIILRAAVSNAITQGVSVAVGWQKSFSWVGVAAAAAGSMMGQMANAAVGDTAQRFLGEGLGKFVTGTVAGIASGATVAMMRGGRVSMTQVAADAFGNALGSSIADAMSSPSAADNRTALNKFNSENDREYYGPAPLTDEQLAAKRAFLFSSGAGPAAGLGEDGSGDAAKWGTGKVSERQRGRTVYLSSEADSTASMLKEAKDLLATLQTDSVSGPGLRATGNSDLEMFGARLGGGVLGVAQSLRGGIDAGIGIGADAAITAFDIATLGTFHDAPLVQQAEIELGAVFAGAIRLGTEPRGVLGEVFERTAASYKEAADLQAHGFEVEAARIRASQSADIAGVVLGGAQFTGDLARLGAAGLRNLGAQDYAFIEGSGIPGGMGRSQRGAVSFFDLEPMGQTGDLSQAAIRARVEANLADNAKARASSGFRNDAWYEARTPDSAFDPAQGGMDWEHFLGEVNSRGRAVGGHVANSRVTELGPRVSVGDSGLYKVAPIKINGVVKGNGSTFYPEWWSDARVRYETYEAFNNKVIPDPVGNPRFWNGVSPSGVEMQGYISPHVTAYPFR